MTVRELILMLQALPPEWTVLVQTGEHRLAAIVDARRAFHSVHRVRRKDGVGGEYTVEHWYEGRREEMGYEQVVEVTPWWPEDPNE